MMKAIMKQSAQQHRVLLEVMEEKHNACSVSGGGRVHEEKDVKIDLDFQLPISSKDDLMELERRLKSEPVFKTKLVSILPQWWIH